MERRKTTLLAAAAALSVSFAARPAAPQRQAAAPQTPTSSNSAADPVRFAYGGNVAEIPAEFIGGLILLPLHINQSQPCLFVLDSTAAATSIDPDRAADLGIPAGQSVELEFAGVNLTLPELPRVPKPNFGARFGREYEGTLGHDFFESFVVAIDYERKTVRLFDPGAYQYSGHGKGFQVSFAGDTPVVRAKSNTNGKTLEGDFGIDTALDASVIFSKSYANAHHMLSHLKTIPAMDEAADDSADAVLGRMKLFQIGPFPVQQAIATFSKLRRRYARRREARGRDWRRNAAALHRDLRLPAHADHLRSQTATGASEEFEDMSGISLAAEAVRGLRTFESDAGAPREPREQKRGCKRATSLRASTKTPPPIFR